MTVQELIDYLIKCDPRLPVRIDLDVDVYSVVEHINHTNERESYVNLM